MKYNQNQKAVFFGLVHKRNTIFLFMFLFNLLFGTLFGQTPYRVKNINGLTGSYPGGMYDFNGKLFFTADNGINGYELWKSDGTDSGTVMVKDIKVGSAASYSGPFASVDSTLYIQGDNGINGFELWKTDGTTAGTVMVKDIRPGSASSSIGAAINYNGTLFFSANDGINGIELWKSDGTATGTIMVKDIYPGSDSSPSYFVEYNDTLYFSAINSVSGRELWKTDGTTAGTVMVKDVFPGSFTSEVNSIVVMNGLMYFSAYYNSYTDGGIWQSDGTGAGTLLVKNFPSALYSPYYPTLLKVFNNILFFWVDNGSLGRELWKSDGTTVGTVLLKDINPGSGESLPQYPAYAIGTGFLFFWANETTTGYASPWRTDGTSAGTYRLSNLYYRDKYTAAEGGIVYFAATDASYGNAEVWYTDGSIGGTTIINYSSGSYESFPANLTNSNGKIFYSGCNGPSTDNELYALDFLTTGIPRENITSLSIYPNPFLDKTIIRFEQVQKNVVVKIVDVLGKEIKTIKFSGTELTIEKEEIKSGVYFVQVIDAGIITANKKIVIQ